MQLNQARDEQKIGKSTAVQEQDGDSSDPGDHGQPKSPSPPRIARQPQIPSSPTDKVTE